MSTKENKEKRRCQASVKKTGKRCEKTVRFGQKYCWMHYPKSGLIIGFSGIILGAFIGFVLPLFFNGPLGSLLSCHWPFYYIDREPPKIDRLEPDIISSKYIENNTRNLRVFCHDDCSRLDLNRCGISLLRQGDNNKYEPIAGKSIWDTNNFNFNMDKNISQGEYTLKVFLVDKAKKSYQSEYKFAVPEENILNMSVFYEEYNDAKPQHINLFKNFNLEEQIKKSGKIKKKFYVYKYAISNDSEKTYCRNLYFKISNQAAIYDWKELSGYKSRGIIFESLTEAVEKNIPQNMVFHSVQMLGIEEIGPGGFIQIVALVEFFIAPNDTPEENIPRGIEVYGTYVSEGYGRTKTENFNHWIQIKKLSIP